MRYLWIAFVVDDNRYISDLQREIIDNHELLHRLSVIQQQWDNGGIEAPQYGAGNDLQPLTAIEKQLIDGTEEYIVATFRGPGKYSPWITVVALDNIPTTYPPEMDDKISWIKEQHKDQSYGALPYVVHLETVADLVDRYYDQIHLPEPKKDIELHSSDITQEVLPSKEVMILAAWGHDLLEDCDVSYDDVREKLGGDVADIIAALTENEGQTRRQRQGPEYYHKICCVHGSRLIKLCDRLANLRYSKCTSPKKHKMYLGEMEMFFGMLGLDTSPAHRQAYAPIVQAFADIIGKDEPRE